MLTTPPTESTAASPTGSAAAFLFAIVGAAAAARLVFDHQIPNRPDDAVVHLGALALGIVACWWLANVLAWSLRLHRGRTISQFTLPGTKRIAQFLLAAALSTSCVADAREDPLMVLVEQGPTTAAPTTAAPTTAVPTTAVPTELDDSAPASQPPAESPPSATAEPAEENLAEPTVTRIEEHQVMVAEGDNLWTMAAATLEAHGISDPACEQVADYWRRVVAANAVRSGNPNLITIGEAITMPAHDLSQTTGISPSGQTSPNADGITVPTRVL